jgi:putative molybdopterin biosynthesis protein
MIDARGMAETRNAANQQQFLDVTTAQEASRRFQAALRLAPLGIEPIALPMLLGRVLGEDIVAPVDVPGFDRANVDGFAVRAEDTAGATDERPALLRLTGEVLTPGVAPTLTLQAGQATLIATGGMLPRGADAVVLVEDTELADDDLGDDSSADDPQRVAIRRPLAPGAFITFSGTDIGRGETVLRAGQLLSSREIGVLAALGLAEVPVYRRPRVAVISTGDEIVAPGEPLAPGSVYDSNGAIVAAAVEELGCEAVRLGAVADERDALAAMLERALACDAVILSGGTSKGAGDLSYEVVSALPDPGIVVHGVAIKPGKPLCLAATAGKPVVILPGFPTSAIFTFHQFVAPVLSRLAGRSGVGAGHRVDATLALRANSERGRTEFLLVGLMPADDGLAAYPSGKGSGAVTAFSHADGYVVIPAQTERLAAGSRVQVQLIAERLSPRTWSPSAATVSGSTICSVACRPRATPPSPYMSAAKAGLPPRAAASAIWRHPSDASTDRALQPRLSDRSIATGRPAIGACKGSCFAETTSAFAIARQVADALANALADPDCVMINRNAGSGTRVLIDALLGDARPLGYAIQSKSHNAVASAVAQGRADWGVAIDTVARLYGLGFLPLQQEDYDFVVPRSRLSRPALRRFLSLLLEDETRAGLRDLGFRLAHA